MRRLTMLGVLAAATMLTAPALAQSVFDGVWKADVKSTQLDEKPSVYELKDGVYSCRTCVPTPVSVKADGNYHKVTGQPYYDEMAVKVVDPRTVKTLRRKDGKPAGESTVAISTDGSLANFSWSEVGPNGTAMSGKGKQKRVAAAPAGGHAISGGWLTTGYDEVSDSGLTITMKVDGDMLHLKTPTGESYAAKFGGEPVALDGDPGGTKIRVRKLGDSSVEEENWRDGKLVGVTVMTIEPDGKTMRASYENKLRGTKMLYKAYKQ